MCQFGKILVSSEQWSQFATTQHFQFEGFLLLALPGPTRYYSPTNHQPTCIEAAGRLSLTKVFML